MLIVLHDNDRILHIYNESIYHEYACCANRVSLIHSVLQHDPNKPQ